METTVKMSKKQEGKKVTEEALREMAQTGTKSFSYKVEIDGEEQLDRMLAKAEKLEATLLRCENYLEATDNGEITENILATAQPQIVFAVTVNEIGQILKSPADMFNPDFIASLNTALPLIFAKPATDA